MASSKLPPVKVGDIINCVHATGSDLYNIGHTVVEVRKTGSFTLACGWKFHADGRGMSGNNLIRAVAEPICPWNDYRLPEAEREALLQADLKTRFNRSSD